MLQAFILIMAKLYVILLYEITYTGTICGCLVVKRLPYHVAAVHNRPGWHALAAPVYLWNLSIVPLMTCRSLSDKVILSVLCSFPTTSLAEKYARHPITGP